MKKNYYVGKIKKLSSNSLLEEFHALPKKMLRNNIIIFIVFVLSFIGMFFGGDLGMILSFIAGPIVLLILNHFLPQDSRYLVALEFKNRSTENYKNVYDYVVEYEKKTKGSFSYIKGEKNLRTINKIFKVFNIIFYIYSGLMLLILTLTFGLCLYLIFTISNLIIHSEDFERLANASLVPIGYVWKFFLNGIMIGTVGENINYENDYKNVDTSAFEGDPKKMKTEYAKYRVYEFINFSKPSLPIYFNYSHFDYSVDINDVYVKIIINVDKNANASDNDCNQVLNNVKANIEKQFKSSVERYMQKYTNAAPKVHLHLEISM